MNMQKLILKIVYCLAGILFLASVGLNIFQLQRSKKLSAGLNGNEKMIQAPEAVTNSSQNIQAQLDKAKEKLKKKKIKLSEERTQKEEYLKMRQRLSAGLSDYSDPGEQKRLRKILSESYSEVYLPMFNKLNISKNDFELLKDMLIDGEMEYRILAENYPVYRRSVEEKKELKKRNKKIKEKYKEKISAFLGEEKNRIYERYEERLSERRSLNNFFELGLTDHQLSEDQLEKLIDAMYTARKSAPDIEDNDDGKMTEAKIAKAVKRLSHIYSKYTEAAYKVMTPELTEKYKIYLKQQIEMNESSLKMDLYLDDTENSTL